MGAADAIIGADKLFGEGRRSLSGPLFVTTDLTLAFHGQSPGYEVIDALDVHVALPADLALNRISLADVTA